MEKLRLCRKKCGLSIEEAALRLKISRNTLSAYESGKLSPPLSVTVNMLKLYNSNTFDLLGVNVPEMELSDTQKLYLAFCEQAISTVNRMERSLINAGHSGYSKERKDEIYNKTLHNLIANITDTEIRSEVIELHNNEII